MTEEQLVKSLKKGSTSALEELIRRYTRYVSSIIARILGGSLDDCDELTSDVFLAAWNNRDKLQEGKLKGYLGAIARNRAFDLLKARQETLPLEDNIILIEEQLTQNEAERLDTAMLLQKALSQLDKQQRELFVRHYYYGQTVGEAAGEMGLNLSTAKTWLSRGREKLREILTKEGYTI